MSKAKGLQSTILLILLLCTACSVQAVEFIGTEQFVRTENEPLDQETWVSAETITVSGSSEDDLFAAAGTLTLSGTFQGDVWGIGTAATASGRFRDHTRIAAQLLRASGTFDGSLTAAGNTIQIEPSASIAQNLLCIGENVIIQGSVAGDVRIVAQNATIGGNIAGDVNITAQDIVILPNTVIGGGITYTAPEELIPSSSVTIGGGLTRHLQEIKATPILKANLITHLMFGIAALLAGLVVASVFPGYTKRSVQMLRNSFGPCILTGFAALFLIPAAAVVLLFTFIGLPLSILLLLAYAILLYLSKITVGFWIGTAIMRRNELSKNIRFASLALGLLILYLITVVNTISMLAGLVIAMLGLGAQLLALFKKPVLVIRTEQTTTEG